MKKSEDLRGVIQSGSGQRGVCRVGVGMKGGAGVLSSGDKLALDLQFALDKTLTARKGPTPVLVRGSGATFIDSDKLVKWANENLTLQSEDFTNSAWQKSGSTITANAAISPDGSTTADLLNEDSALSSHLTQQSNRSILAGQPYTFSVFAKAASHTSFQLSLSTTVFGAGLYANFLLTGSGSVGTFNGVAATIQSYPNGWYRCSVSLTPVAGGSGGFTGCVSNNNNNSAARIPSYQGTGAQVVYLWGAQLERSSTPRAYNPTTAAVFRGPRFDHDPVTGVCKGLLMEESRTNICLQSENFGTTWAFNNATATLNVATAPDGFSTADKIINGNGLAQGRVQQSFTLTGSHVYSVFAKANEWGWVFIAPLQATGGVWFNLSNGTIGTQNAGFVGSITSFGNGWFRCAVQCTGTSSPLTARIHPTNADAVLANGDGLSGILLWGAQMEAGSFPTSYIPTTTGTLARSADVCSITGSAFSGFYNATGGTVTTSQIVNTTSTTTKPEACRIAGTGGQLQFGTTNGTTEALRFYSVNGANIKSLRTGTRASGVPFKTAVAFGNNDLAACLDGGTVLTDTTSHTIIIGTSMIIGQTPANIQIAYIRYYKKRLPNSKLQALTV